MLRTHCYRAELNFLFCFLNCLTNPYTRMYLFIHSPIYFSYYMDILHMYINTNYSFAGAFISFVNLSLTHMNITAFIPLLVLLSHR